MIRYQRISLNNIVYYKEAELNLDYTGLTVIMGLNRNATSKNRRNGTGKSLLLSPLHHLRYPNPSVKVPRTDKHHLFKANSSIEWELSIDDDQYHLVKSANAKRTIKWKILKNGEDLKPRTATVAEGMVNELLPLTEEQFYSTVYLDSRRPSVVINGTATERQHYLSALFNLESFDGIRAYFRSKSKQIEKLEVEQGVHKQALQASKWVKEFDLDAAKARIEGIEADIARREEIRKKLLTHEAERDLWDTYGKYLKPASKYNRDTYENAKRMSEMWLTYEEKLKTYKTSLDKRVQFEEEAEKVREVFVLKDTPDEHLRVELRSILANLHKIDAERQAGIAEWKRRNSELKELAGQRKKAQAILKNTAKPDTEKMGKIDRRLVLIEGQMIQLRKHKGAECLYCGAPLDAEEAAKKLKIVEARHKKLKAQYDKMNLQYREYQEAKRLWSKHLESRYEALKNQEKPDLPGKVDKSMFELDKLGLHWEEPVGKPIKPGMSKAEAAKTLKEQERYRTAHLSVRHQRESIERGETRPELHEIQDKLEKLELRIKNDRQLVVDLKSGLSSYMTERKQYSSTVKKIKSLTSKTKHKKIVDVLVEAYGNKGVKLLVLRNLCTHIADNLNRFAPLLFPETFKFSISVDVNTLNILVDRGGDLVSDIRYLSGAEGRMFSLLWLLSILPILPEKTRSNLVVLDEFEAGVDKTTREMIFDEYLPELNKIVEHIVFITPNEVEPKRGRKVLVAVKEGSTSELVPYTELAA